MKKATKQILEIVRGKLVYYLSVLQKQNDSGIMFNQRIFFLLSGHHIGYLSEVDMNKPATDLHFQKAKKTILLTDIKSMTIKDKSLIIKFEIIQQHQTHQRVWNLRAESVQLTAKWHQILQREKMNIMVDKGRNQEGLRQEQIIQPQSAEIKVSNNQKRNEFQARKDEQLDLNIKSRQPDPINKNQQNQPKIDLKVSLPEKRKQLPWTYRYIKSNELIFNDFKEYSQNIMEEIIQPKQNKKYKPTAIEDGIYYFYIDDLEIKIAIIDLQKSYIINNNHNQQVSSKKAIKTLQNEFNLFKKLFQYLQNYPTLRVPLVTLCEYYGFIALFKAVSKSSKKALEQDEIQTQLNLLNLQYKMEIENLQQGIILLDEQYYDSIKAQDGKQLNFHCYFIENITQIKRLDLLISRGTVLQRQHSYFRERSVLNQKQLQIETSRSRNLNSSKTHQKQQTVRTLTQAIFQLNQLQRYFINSSELSQYLHQKGISLRSLGQIYQGLKTSVQRQIVMAEISARSCKTLFRKTMQDEIIDQDPMSKQGLFILICDFLNCVLGNTYETTAIWKVLSAHSSAYFGVSINPNQISKGYFLISLIQNCQLEVNWSQLNPEGIFKTNTFFRKDNLNGLVAKHKTYPYHMNRQYRTASKILSKEYNQAGFDKLAIEFNLKSCTIPNFLQDISGKIKKYLSYFIDPVTAESEYPHLNIFETSKHICPSRTTYEAHLIAIKWWLKLRNRQAYICAYDDFIKSVTRFFGQFHPILSELYDLFSAYHLGVSEYQDAIIFAKSSLINMLRLLGPNHHRTSEYYYHLGLCYMAARYDQQAIDNIQRSLQILNSIGQSQTASYSIISMKLGYLYSNSNRIEDALILTSNALDILQNLNSQDPCEYEQKIIECYQIMIRCFALLNSSLGMREIACKCAAKLAAITNCNNLSRGVKIVLYPLLRDLSKEKAIHLVKMIKILPRQMDYQTAYSLVASRITQQTLINQFTVYLNQVINISKIISPQKSEIKKSSASKKRQETSKININTSLITQLIVYLGEDYFLTTLRDGEIY